MKTLVISLLAMGSVLTTSAQQVIYETKVKKEKVPKIVLGSVKEQMPKYVYREFNASPAKNAKNKIVINNNNLGNEGFYQVNLLGKNKKIVNTYDKSGKLMETKEVAKNEKLPEEIATVIAETYPGWSIHKDVYRLNRYADSREDEKYRIILEKGNKKININMNATGGILNNEVHIAQKSL